jgi:2-polyprenyl-3-methyl-5-hydroxy-6-metoxy-1,4-benzoquinol methylase
MVAYHTPVLFLLKCLGLAKPIARKDSRHQRILEVVRSLSLDKNSPILDLGCADCSLLLALQKEGYTNLSGVDLGEKPVLPVDIKYVTLDLNKSFKSIQGDFKLIICSQVIEHLESPVQLIKKTSNKLSDRGFFILTYPNCENIFMRLGFFLKGTMPRYRPRLSSKYMGHINIMPMNLLRYIVEPYFKVVKRVGNISIWKRHWLKFAPLSPFFAFQSIYILRRKVDLRGRI